MKSQWTLMSALCVLTGLTGCAKPAERSSEAQTAVVVADTGPSAVEIGAAKAHWHDDHTVHFEIPYRFTTGSPNKVYSWKISFPGTGETGVRPTEGWELKHEGIQKTGIVVSATDLAKFAVELHEAESPDRSYHLISNQVIGEIEPWTPPEPAK